MPIATGTRFDRYQIISPIGSGGMGEIYLAQDTRLNRKVAIKLLPERYTQDSERLRRFEQEAQAASALNHPNIITIFEIGEAGGRHFIATEYIEGATLRRRMLGAKLEVGEALDIAQQVVSALTAAHAAGIVHRDIKPENIMIRPDGYVKILDFGLAKLTERASAPNLFRAEQAQAVLTVADAPTGESEVPTTADLILDDEDQSESEDPFATIPPSAANETVPGVVMGTAQYMSPEQARGLRVDARTDIFSFGIVLYEIIARRAPFTGARSRDIVNSILNVDPPPLSHFQPDVPEVLEWIVAKALVKDREERYQTAKEMLNDLRRLRSRLGVEHELEKSRGFDSGDVNADSGGTRVTLSGKSTEEFGPGTGPLVRAITTKSLFRLKGLLFKLFSGVSGRRRFFVLLMLAAFGFGFGFYGFYRYLASKWRPAPPFRTMQVRRFTSSGKITRAAISPDGKYVVHVLNEAGKQSLLVRQVTESNNIVIVPPAEVTYQGLTFSRDGARVYYVVQEQINPIRTLYQVPALGGVSNKIVKDVDSPVAVSPDNKQLAFVRRNRGIEDAVIIVDVDGGNERKLATRKGADFFGVGGPAWSPDGKVIVVPAGSNTSGRRMYVAEINVTDGREKQVSERLWASVRRISWAPYSSTANQGLIFSAVERGSTLGQIWYLPYPNGPLRRITNDLNDYQDLTLTDDSTALITAQSESHVNVWISTSPSGSDRQITDGVGQNNGVSGLGWLPDGRLVYVSRPYGGQDLWVMDQDGKNQKQLTAEPAADRYPAVTPDGRYIVFVSTRTNNSNLYRYDLNSGEQKQLTSGDSEEFPSISADSKWVIYAATGSTKHTLWKVSIDGGKPEQLTDKLSTWPVVSPDGQTIACWYRAEPEASWQIAIIPISGGNPEKVFDVPPNADWAIPTRWIPDGSGISFVATHDGVSNIWNQPLEGGPPKQLTDFAADQIHWFDWSRDGKHLACSRGKTMNDIVLITESKP